MSVRFPASQLEEVDIEGLETLGEATPGHPTWIDVEGHDVALIGDAFDCEGIEIRFPHRSLYAGSVTDPFPVQLVCETAKESEAKDEFDLRLADLAS
jgi:hypothetical protein